MGVTNFDTIQHEGGKSVPKLIGSGTTPATGWTGAGSGSSEYAYKDVTVAGAAAGDVVSATYNGANMAGAAPSSIRAVSGYVTSANTVRLYFVEVIGGTNSGGVANIGATVSYLVVRP